MQLKLNKCGAFMASLALVWTLRPASLEAAAPQNDVLRRLIEMEKLTIGPTDNYQGIYIASQNSVIYTQMLNLAPRLFTFNLGSDRAAPLLGERFDAKDPDLSPSEKQLAFVYFKTSSRGDICTMTLPQGEPQCLHSLDSAQREPFWFDEKTIGYVSRNFVSGVWSIMQYNLDSRESKVLYSGEASSPAYDSHTGLMVFAAPVEGARIRNHGLYQFDMASGKPVALDLDLPGVSGFPEFSNDGKYLYFTQFLNDSNRDAKIDGSDHGVVFRLPVSDLKERKKTLIPEQMTSVDRNCSYPSPGVESLYLTCAFFDSLDVYRLPLTGVVPTEWKEADLEQAYWAARLYEHRILLTNTRMARNGKGSDQDYQRLLLDHLQIDEFDAALFYLDKISDKRLSKADKRATALWIALKRRFSELPKGQVSPAFRNFVQNSQSELKTLQGKTPIANFAAVLGQDLLGNREQALTIFSMGENAPNKASKLTTYQSYFYLNLVNRILEKHPDRLRQIIAKEVNEMTDSALIAYWGNIYLDLAEKKAGNPAAYRALLDTLVSKELTNPKLDKILASERLALDIALAKTEDVKRKSWGELNKIMTGLGGETILSRVLYVRTINKLQRDEDLKYLDLIAANWQRLTPMTSMEFDYVVRQYGLTYMDKGYGRMAEGEKKPAQGIFYGLVTGTGDLEAHYQFMSLSLENDGPEATKVAYENLRGRGFLAQIEPYIEGLTYLKTKKGKLEASDYKKVIEKVRLGRVDVRGAAMHFLLLGYAYVELVAASQKGYTYDKEAAEQAHYYLAMARDVGQANRRISAAALENLGYLNAITRNFGSSANYYLARYELGFDTLDEQKQLIWVLSKTLYHARQHPVAVDLLQKFLKVLPESDRLWLPLKQRLAAHAYLQGNWTVAKESYETLLAKKSQLSAQNLAAVYLSYGDSLRQSGDCQRAVSTLQELPAMVETGQLKPHASDLVSYEPQRILYQAYGLMGRCQGGAAEGFASRAKRREILEKFSNKPKEFHLSGGELWRQIIKSQLQDVSYLRKAGRSDELNQSLQAVSQNIEKYYKEVGDPFDAMLHLMLRNYMAVRLEQKGGVAVSGKESEIIKDIMAAYHKAFAKLRPSDVQPYAFRLEMDMYWLAYEAKFIKKSANLAGMDQILSEQYGKDLKQGYPELYRRADLLRDSLSERL